MSAAELAAALQGLWPHLAAVALCAARILPVAFLCPMLGGQAAPPTVRLTVALALALPLHLAAGVGVPAGFNDWELAGAAGRELLFGTALGLVAALPFDAARIGGRFIDLFRGTSAEAALPVAGTRESATGDGLYQLVVALAIAGGGASLTLAALWRSFALVPLGGAVPSESLATQAVTFATAALAVGLAIGAPIAGLALLIDAVTGLVSRAAPQLQIPDVSTPVRILAGGAALWLGLGLVADRLLATVAGSEEWMRAIAEAAR